MEARRPTLLVRGQAVVVSQFEVSVIDGVDRGKRAVSTSDELVIGTAEGNDLQLTDPSVSRHHCTLRVDERGLALRDLGSRNGTQVGGVEVGRGHVTPGSRIRIGQTTLAIDVLHSDVEQPIASADRYGSLIGSSPAMRRVYPLIEACARNTAIVLIQGETGTGKELIAEAIHAGSERRDGPFVVIDCSALSHDLAESELFGHERGAFTGADSAHAGAFETAHGGTVLLDRVGDMPLALQPLLLRVLESRTVRRIGSNDQRPVDVRVIASAQRDLRELVNTKRFRADLYYRLNVIRIAVPPLRERAEDIPLIATAAWHALRADPIPTALVDQLATQSWPGNVRELRNAVERAASLGWSQQRVPTRRQEQSYGEAKEAALSAWERTWVEELLAAHAGNLSRAARAARMGRTHLRELARAHAIATRPSAVELDADD
jgi:DNA-binding NtrC family response regulator